MNAEEPDVPILLSKATRQAADFVVIDDPLGQPVDSADKEKIDECRKEFAHYLRMRGIPSPPHPPTAKRNIAVCPDVWPEVEKILGLQNVPMEPIGMTVEFKLYERVTATITFQLREDHVEQLAAIAARGLIVLQPIARPEG